MDREAAQDLGTSESHGRVWYGQRPNLDLTAAARLGKGYNVRSDRPDREGDNCQIEAHGVNHSVVLSRSVNQR